MMCLSAGVIAAGLVFIPAMALSAPPPDVARIDAVHESIQKASKAPGGLRSSSGDVANAFTEAVQAQCLAVAQGMGHARAALVAEVGSDEFKAFVTRTVAGRLERVWTMRDAGAARAALGGQLINLLNPRAAEELLADWLEQPSPGALFGRELARAPQSVFSQQVGGTSKGELRVDAASSKLLKDLGGSGSGNGVLDAGEWALLSIGMENTSDLPYYSSSAWLRSDDECLWVESAGERLLGEMAPHGGATDLTFWVFVSEDCRASGKLTLDVKDSNRNPKTARELEITLKPRALLSGGLENVRVDIDVPGFSDGAKDDELRPGWKGEVSADLGLGLGSANAARMRIGTTPETLRLFPTFEMRSTDMLPEGDTSFLAADDLDIECADSTTFGFELANLGRGARWLGAGGGTIWLAVDVELESAAPGDSGVGPQVEQAGTLTAERLSKIEGIVGDYIELRSRPGKPTLDGSVAASEAVEAILDADGFRKRVAAITGLVGGSDGAADRHTAQYRLRAYVPLRVAGAPNRVAVREEPVFEPEPDLEPEPEPEPERDLWEMPHRTTFRFVPLALARIAPAGAAPIVGYQLSLGVETIDRPVGFYFNAGFTPLPALGRVVLPVRIGAQFNLNGIPAVARDASWLNVTFRGGGAIDAVLFADLAFGFEIGAAVDFFLTEHFSLGTGIHLGATRGVFSGTHYENFTWDAVRLGFQ